MKNIFYKSLFWIVGILISISLIIFLYLFAFYFNFFGALENSGSNIKSSYPNQLVPRKIQTQIEVSNPDLELIPGILLNIKVIYNDRKSLSIPEESLVIQGNNKFVYLIENNILKRNEIKIGLRNFGKVEVLSGLKAGDQIVAEGTNKVRNKAKVIIKKSNKKRKIFPQNLNVTLGLKSGCHNGRMSAG